LINNTPKKTFSDRYSPYHDIGSLIFNKSSPTGFNHKLTHSASKERIRENFNSRRIFNLEDSTNDKSSTPKFKEGIKTLPVVLGLKRSKQVIGVFFILTYSSVYFIVEEKVLLIPMVVLGCIQYILVNRKNYQEKWLFTAYLLGMISLMVLLAFLPVKV